MEFLKSKRNKPLLIYKNFIYNLDSNYKNSQFKRYRCQKKGNKGISACKGYILLDQNNNIIEIATHTTHLEEKEKVNRLKFLNTLGKSALETKDNPIDILSAMTSKISSNEIKNLPRVKSLIDKITKLRKNNMPKLLNDFSLPYTLKTTLNGCNFLLCDEYLSERERILIFVSTFSKEIITKTKIFLMDGTFRICPTKFYQVFSVHAYVYNKTIPVVFALLPGKSIEIYNYLFIKLKSEINFNPEIVVIDFEVAIKTSLESIYENIKLQGCSFHFSQTLWRKLGTLGLISLYKEKKEVYECVRNILNLTFVNPNEVCTFYNIIKSKIKEYNIGEILVKFTNYFEKNYLGNYMQSENYYNTNVFKIEFWNCFDRTLQDIPRTINSVEAWHRSINKRAKTPHLNLVNIIFLLQREEESARVKFLQLKELNISANFNLMYDYKLKMLLNNKKYYNDDEYLTTLNKLVEWKLKIIQ